MTWEWLTLIGSLPETIKGLSKKSRTNVVTKKLLLSELKNNLKHYKTAMQNNFYHVQLVYLLENTEIQQARKSGFRFSKVKKGKINAEVLKDKRNNRYLGKDCEWLFLNISDKIAELKSLYSINPPPNLDNSNMSLQFSNLFYKMKLLAEFIND